MDHIIYCKKNCVFILLFTFLYGFSYAQKPDAVLLNTETTIEIKGSKMITKHFYSILINNRNGDSYAEISIPFNKMNSISDLRASITDNSGAKVKSLKKDDITVRSAISESSFFNDTYLKEFSIRNNTYPYTFTYSYQEETSQFLYLEHWVPVIDNKVPTLEAKLILILPKDYKINFRANKVEEPIIDSSSDVLKYQWKASYSQIVIPETWSPSVWQFIPSVDIVPLNFRYNTQGAQDTWKSYGDWNLSMQSGLDELPKTELGIIHELTDSIKETKEKVRALFHYLQSNTRYINVSLKTGGFKPYPASYVAEKKYGDCKALANYFKACLTAVGIKSYYTLINAGTVKELFDAAFPSSQFNHVIVFVPLIKDTLWVDCTSDLALGYLGTFTQNRPALVIDKNNSKLINTPALTLKDVEISRTINAVVANDNSIESEFSGTYRGYTYEMISQIKSEFSETERNILLSRYVVATCFQLDKYSIAKPGPDIPEIDLKYTAISDQFVKAYGNETLLKIIPIELPLIEDPKKRKLPVQIDYPEYFIDTINYTLPASYSVASLPENIRLKSIYGDYQVDYFMNGVSAQVVKKLRINAGMVNLNEYLTFYKFYNGILESEKSLYITLTQH